MINNLNEDELREVHGGSLHPSTQVLQPVFYVQHWGPQVLNPYDPDPVPPNDVDPKFEPVPWEPPSELPSDDVIDWG